MSRWAHVAAVFRINCLGDQSFEDVFGKEVVWPDFDDPDYDAKFDEFLERMNDAAEHPEDYLPCGSEGSLEYGIVVNPKYRFPHYEVIVVGDLRDYYDDEKIVEWFHECCDKIDWLRQAVLHVKTTDGEEILVGRKE